MVVVDPFMGTGATLLAVKHINMSGTTITGIGIEIDPKYIEVAKNRLDIKDQDFS